MAKAMSSVRRVAITASLSVYALLETPASLAAPRIGGYKFIGSVDTMKLSKDKAKEGFTSTDAQAVDLASKMAVTHITVDTPLQYPSVMVQWADRIHADGKHVWFRLGSTTNGQPHADASKAVNYQPPYDGYPNFGPGYLTKLHKLMLAHPGLVQPGDILDGDAEAENSGWWAKNYGCGVQQGCAPCPSIQSMTSAKYRCSPISEINRFLQTMTTQEKKDLASQGIAACASPTESNCVVTQVHSVDPGTATEQLSSTTVKAMGNLITVDAFPDESLTDPTLAANAWSSSLQAWENAWKSRGIEVTILIGEWGYSNGINVSDATQKEVVKAEIAKALSISPYLAGANYWVGPGDDFAGGYTNIFAQNSSLVWQFRPAANEVSAFYSSMNAGG